ncbi:hypothetical protein GJ496_004648 [Pomphorhynchus laevis]|nr:hypothetical protein GJ496_004648 [Pomphorhynchus laevis]
MKDGIGKGKKADVETTVALQQTFDCCGIDSRLDWPLADQLKRCKIIDIRAPGCRAAVTTFIQNNIKLIMSALGVFMAIEAIGVISSTCVICR